MADNNRYWCKIYDMTEWEWWTDSKMVKMFIFLITHVTYRREHLPSGNIIRRGEMETTIRNLMEILNMTTKEVRVSIDRMQRTGNIKIRVEHKHTIITVLNYDKYQGKTTKSQYNTSISNSKENISNIENKSDSNTKKEDLGQNIYAKNTKDYINKYKGKKTVENTINRGVSIGNKDIDISISVTDLNSTVGAKSNNKIKERGKISFKTGQNIYGSSKSSKNSDKQRTSESLLNGKISPKNSDWGKIRSKTGKNKGKINIILKNDENYDKHVDTEDFNDSENNELGQNNGQKTGEKHPHIEYNRIIEGINKYINTSKIFSKSLDSTEKSKIVSSILKSIGIEEMQEKENETNSPEEISQEENVQVDEALTLKEKKPTKKRPPKENVTLISKCRRIFEPYYKRHIGEEYYWEAKDGGGMKYLIQKIKKARSDRGQPTDDENIIMAWSALLDSISDQWMLEHLSIVNINSKYNEIVASAKRDKSNGTGGKEKSIKNGEDKYERKQRVIAERQRKLMASTDADDAMFALFRSKKDAGEIPESVSIDEWLRSTMAEESIS